MLQIKFNCFAIAIIAVISFSVVNGQLGLPGGLSDVEESEVIEVKKKVNDSLAKLSGQADGVSLTLIEVHEVKKQVVSGRLYKVKATFAAANEPNKICSVNIWEQPWLQRTQTDFKCGEQKYQVVHEPESNAIQRSKRAIGGRAVGAPVEVPDEEVHELAGKVSDSLVQLESENGPRYGFKRILNATKQVVAGVAYDISAEFIDPETNQPRVCTLRIWEQPWLNFTQVDITCDDKKYQVVKNRPKREMPLLEEPMKTDAELEAEDLFQKFKTKYQRSYANPAEHDKRFRIFKNSLFLINQLRKYELGTAKYGLTEFADMTSEEYQQRTGLRVRREDSNYVPNPPAEIPNIELPTSWDWREKNAVTAVKNQGSCGSCWAFSVTGNIEGVKAAKTGVLESYSEQELLDCDTVDGACRGGLPDDAYKAIESIGGLELESEYPYKARKSACTFNSTLVHVRVKGAVDLPKDEAAIAKYLVENGPISIGINANAMQFYRGGVSHPWKALCRPGNLDHGVLLVGFGIADYPVFNKTLPYWIVKNSWGPKWGEQGYYRVFRGDNTCGVSSMASSAVLA